MAAPGTPPEHEDGAVRRELITEQRSVRRPLGSAYTVVFFAVPLLLTALIGMARADSVEGELRGDAAAALSDRGVEDVELRLHGRDITALVPTGQNPDRVRSALEQMDGAGTVTIERVYASDEEARACSTLPQKLDKATNDQRIPFAGTSTQLTPNGVRMMREVATLLKACEPAVVTVGGHSDPRTSNGSTVSLKRARVMVRFLRDAGVDPDRLRPRGYGNQFPMSKGSGPGDQAANQRGSVQVVTS